MSKPEWGAKRICHNCGTRYYDFLRSPIVCPNCSTEYDPDAFLKSRRARSIASEEGGAAAKRKVAKLAPAKVVEDELEATAAEPAEADELEVEEEDDTDTKLDDLDGDTDEDLMEDASELGEDDGDDVIDIETPTGEEDT